MKPKRRNTTTKTGDKMKKNKKLLEKKPKSKLNPNDSLIKNKNIASDTVPVPETVFPVQPELLPAYNSVLKRSVHAGINMEELDELQHNLEKSLSNCAARHKYLTSEVKIMNRRKIEKVKKAELVKKNVKQPQLQPVQQNSVQSGLVENSQINIPRQENPVADNFWASVEPYFAKVKTTDVKYLDGLIQECSQKVSTNIPPLGKHYSLQMVNDESANISQRFFRRRLKEKQRINRLFKDYQSPNKNICANRKLKIELTEQGILGDEENDSSDDEILKELKKNIDELQKISIKNISQLTDLKHEVVKCLKREELEEELDKVNQQIIEMNNKIFTEKQYPTFLANNDAIISSAYPEASKILQKQAALLQKLREFQDP